MRKDDHVSATAGVVSFGQLLDAGVSRSQVRRLVSQGRLTCIRRGVYVPARQSTATTDEARHHALRVAAAVAVSGSQVVASHRTAAVIHGLDLMGRQHAGQVTVTRSPDGRGSRSRQQGTQVHSAALPSQHVTVRQGIAVTTVARTVVDLARECSFTEGVVVADSALRARKTTVTEINSVVADCERWPGVKRARRVAAFSDSRSESALESIGRAVFHEHGLPPAELQVGVGCEELGAIGRADFLWSAYRTIAEADGALKYASPGRAVGQLSRDALLRDAGFEVVHFTWQEITTTPWQVVARVRAAFLRGAA